MNLFQRVEQEARRRELTFVVIGGIAVIEHGYPRLTTDFDLLVQREAKEKWHSLMVALGYALDTDKGSFRQYVATEGIEWPVDLMLVHEQTFRDIIAASSVVDVQGAQLRVSSLEHLLALKLHALKHTRIKRFFKDFDDVIHLVQVNRIDLHSQAIRDLFLKYGNNDLYGKICRACEAE